MEDVETTNKKRRDRDDYEKLRVVEEYKNGQYASIRQFCELKKLPLSSVATWIREYDLHKLTPSTASGHKRKRNGEYVEVEQRVFEHIAKMQNEKQTYSRAQLLEKAAEFGKEIYGDNSFKASSGWLTRCLQRKNISRLGRIDTTIALDAVSYDDCGAIIDIPQFNSYGMPKTFDEYEECWRRVLEYTRANYPTVSGALETIHNNVKDIQSSRVNVIELVQE